MPQYAIVANPGHNRIYLDAALDIARLELQAIAGRAGIRISEFSEDDLGLPASLIFSTTETLDSAALRAVASASVYYILFEVLADGLLRPMQTPPIHTFPEGMSQILKYAGKTNEQFTRLMVNLALSASHTGSNRIKLLDPMCGKGTTLYEGLVRGFDVEGIEINRSWTQESETYVIRYLKTGRYKHKAASSKRNGPNGNKIADGFAVDTAADKADFNAGRVQRLSLYCADTRNAHLLLKKNSFDILVADLPYGIQHGNKNADDGNRERRPAALLSEALPAWRQVLKNQGAAVLSFNEFTLSRVDAASALTAAGFEVLDSPPYTGFIHRVDQSIKRNLIVAVKR